jgi:hypothetical protein
MPVIPATQEAEIRKIMIQSQANRLYLKKPHYKNRAGRVAQGESPK